MTRLERKNRTDIVFKGCGGITDALDDALKELWRVNDEEFDYIAETASDEELQAILPPFKSIKDVKNALIISNKLLINFKNS